MEIVVLGGTSFVGHAVVAEALARGHEVRTFNRGRSGPDQPGVSAIHGDRTVDAALALLADLRPDAVTDTCGYVPEVVGRAARLLAKIAGSYAFVSSCSAAGFPTVRITADTPGLPCAPDADVDDGDYGELKAGCERAVEQAFGDHAWIVRPGIILGPRENVGRLPWWPHRIAKGGRVLAPGDPHVRMQVLDARDLAAWLIDGAERGVTGCYPATGVQGGTTYGRWLADCVDVTGSKGELVWVDDAVLLQHEVEPWSELPLWIPLTPDVPHVWDVDSSTAYATGLRCRPRLFATRGRGCRPTAGSPRLPTTCRAWASTRPRSSASSTR
jgi:2'-hydroxyisoflavone reductase